jgi:hypothetical protein
MQTWAEKPLSVNETSSSGGPPSPLGFGTVVIGTRNEPPLPHNDAIGRSFANMGMLSGNGTIGGDLVNSGTF